VRPSSSRGGFDVKSGYSFLATFALYAANFLIVLLAVLIPMDTLAGEIGSGTIQSLAVKPLRRSQIVLGFSEPTLNELSLGFFHTTPCLG